MAAVAEAAAMVRKDRRVGRVIISYLPMDGAEVLPPRYHRSVYCILVSSINLDRPAWSPRRERKRVIGNHGICRQGGAGAQDGGGSRGGGTAQPHPLPRAAGGKPAPAGGSGGGAGGEPHSPAGGVPPPRGRGAGHH